MRVLAAAGFMASAATGLGQPAFLFEPTSISVSPGANVFFQSIAFGDGPIASGPGHAGLIPVVEVAARAERLEAVQR